MSLESPILNQKRSLAITANRFLYWTSLHWLFVLIFIWSAFIISPFLAPVFMKLGWTSAAGVIYLIFSFECHQLPQRSFFLFGPKLMYSLPEIQAAWQPTNNPLILRQFIGNEELGWKVAWCERTTWMYTTILCAGLLYGLFWRRLKAFPLWVFVLLTTPLALDGGSHFLSDLTSGFNNGFRDNNVWLAQLTHYAFFTSFYSGDALGSFNSWMRLSTGILFGIGVVGLVFPLLEAQFSGTAQRIESKFHRAGLPLFTNLPRIKETNHD